MTAVEDDSVVEECLRLGAADYLFKPFDLKLVRQLIPKARIVHRLWRQNRSLRVQAGSRAVKRVQLQSKSPLFQRVIQQAARLRGKSLSVLITGETGVGKDIMAQYLWGIEDDDGRPFIPVHCGAISPNLVESELFGHKKGAFTGASENRIGKFEEADGGDIFLDEVATMPLDVQVKLLRTLNNGEITPVGSNVPKRLHFRVIAATNEDLEQLVAKKKFREDLLYRLRQVALAIPPLRQRKEDIPDLIDLYLSQSHPEKQLSAAALSICLNYDWPGNLRELRNVIETAAELCEGTEIGFHDVSSQLQTPSAINAGQSHIPTEKRLFPDSSPVRGNFVNVVRATEQHLVRRAIEETGSDAKAAAFLGIPRSTLRSKLKQWGWKSQSAD